MELNDKYSHMTEKALRRKKLKLMIDQTFYKKEMQIFLADQQIYTGAIKFKNRDMPDRANDYLEGCRLALARIAIELALIDKLIEKL